MTYLDPRGIVGRIYKETHIYKDKEIFKHKLHIEALGLMVSEKILLCFTIITL